MRPASVKSFSEAQAFSKVWMREVSDVVGYIFKSPTDRPPSIFMNRESNAKLKIFSVEK